MNLQNSRIGFWRRPKRWVPLCVALGALSAEVDAQTAFMVKDIATGSVPVAGYIDYYLMYSFNGHAYFAADDGVHGRELWRTDGTAAGTVIVKDICPGACQGLPYAFNVAQNQIFFLADDGEHGVELWRSDGTSAGTSMVIDLRPGLQRPNYSDWMPLANNLLFVATTPGQGCELFLTDGTAAGTSSLLSLSYGEECPGLMAAVGATAFFSAGDPTTGRELWKTDGTQLGTMLVKDILPGNAGGVEADQWRPRGSFFARAFGNQLIFRARDAGNDWEVWHSDGTEAGTQLLLDVRPGGSGSSPLFFTESGGQLFFVADDGTHGLELWRSNGTPVGTQLVADSVAGSNGSHPSLLRDVDGVLFFRASTPATGSELWRSDGTEIGTSLIRDIWPGPDSSMGNLFFLGAGAVDDRLFFFANDGTAGLEPWVSDGTEIGTQFLADVAAGPAGSSFGFYVPAEPIAIGSSAAMLLYSLDFGLEPWISDGSPGGSQLLKEIDAQASAFPPWMTQYTQLRGLTKTTSDGLLFMQALHETHGVEPWATDGTPTGTVLLADVNPGVQPSGFPASSFPSEFTTVPSGVTFFRGSETGVGDRLWSTDGTPANTFDLGTLPLGNPSELANLGNQLLVGSETGLWDFNITTHVATQLFEGNYASYITSSGTHAFFSTYSGGPGSILALTNGTAGGTAPFAPFDAAGDRLDVDGQFYFVGDDHTHGPELWTAAAGGPQLVKDIRPGTASGFYAALGFPPRLFPSLSSAGNLLFLRTDDGTHGFELWTSAGTDETTQLTADICPGPMPSDPVFLAGNETRVLFAANDGVHGREPWMSDGTPLGTYMLKDVLPGPEGSRPLSAAEADGTFFFSALDAEHGVELWATDGSAPGTLLIEDINPGAEHSTPFELTVSGPYLYFTANDGAHGFELWARPILSRWLAAEGLAIDDSAVGNGNGIWEVGEAVALQPSWRNRTITALPAIDGEMTGPALFLVDHASYGPFAPNESRSCDDTGFCYAAALAGPRPAAHWDLELTETLSSAFVAAWPVHIGESFTDISVGDTAYSDAEALLHAGLTMGCTATSFCPGLAVTRAQAALFLTLGSAGVSAVPLSGNVPGKGDYDCSAGGTSVFTDVDPEDPFCPFVHDLAARQITQGCALDRYCPDGALSRAQLALLLGKALSEGTIPTSFSGPGGTYDCAPGTPTIHFLDVDETHAFCAAAHYLWAIEISAGCDASRFCPDGPVTRADAAGPLVRAFEVQLP